jgi:Cytochrome P460
MNRKTLLTIGIAMAVPVVLGARALSAQDKYTLKVPGGLAFSEFKGYENWQLVSISQNGKLIAAILGNSTVIDAFRAGVPGNGKPFPDGSRMAKIHWVPKQNTDAPGPPTVPGTQHDVDFMVKDSKRFADGGGWGYAAFNHDAASDTFAPATTADHPPQGNDARCGVACHTKAKARDFVFTEYGKR